MDHIAQASDALLRARRERCRIPAFARTPETIAEAYAIQDAVTRQLGPVQGWKVGASGPQAEPTCAPLFPVYSSPAALAARDFNVLGIEAEMAFTVDRDLPMRSTPYGRDEVLDALSMAHAGIEIADTRFEAWPKIPTLTKLSDNGSNGAYVFGPGRSDWRSLDFTRQAATLYCDDVTAVDTVGGNAAGDPLRLVVWLANHLTGRCGGLKSGQVITTGSCTGIHFVEAGTRLRAVLPGIGEASACAS